MTGIGDKAEGAPNHTTRTLLIDPTDNNYAYLSNGAPCNVCREEDTSRAAIHRYPVTNLSHGEHSVIATGLRNAVGLAIDPETGDLWASCAERNGLGADAPKEFVTRIMPGAFYGWPLAYGNHQWDEFTDSEYHAMLPLTHADSVRVKNMSVPDLAFDAHSTPLGIAFESGSNFPADCQHDLLIALHGSYNSPDGRLVANGSKIVRAHRDGATWTTSDFATGFLTDSIAYARWACPCGVIFDHSGNMYFSSDHASPHSAPAIFRIRYVGTGSVDAPDAAATKLHIAQRGRTIELARTSGGTAEVEVLDILGRAMLRQHIDGNHATMDARTLSAGTYIIRISDGKATLSIPMQLRGSH